MRTWLLVGLLATSACDLFSTLNPAYCDQDAQCQTGATCDMQLHHCSNGTGTTHPDPNAPTLTAVSPQIIDNAGGGTITLYGSNFSADMTVLIKNTAANVMQVSPAGDTATVTVPTFNTRPCGLAQIEVISSKGGQVVNSSLLRFGYSSLVFTNPAPFNPRKNTTDIATINYPSGFAELASVNMDSLNSLEVHHVAPNIGTATPMNQTVAYSLVLSAKFNNSYPLPGVLTFGNLGVEAWENQGNHVFVDIPSSRASFNPAAPAAAIDVDADGTIDLITGNGMVGATGLIAVRGLGSPIGFGMQTLIPLGATPGALAVADFNNDTYGDFAVTVPGMNLVQVYFGGPSFTFSGPTDITAASASSVAVADVNADGKPDLLVGFANSLMVLLNQDGRNFTALAMNNALATRPDFLQVADLNCDGLPDIIYGKKADTTCYVQPNIGVSPFYPNSAQGIPVGGNLMKIDTGNFNVDSLPDIALLYVSSTSFMSAIAIINNTSAR